MKTFIYLYFTLFTLIFAINVNSQIPSYTLEAKNSVFATDLKSVTFELVITHTNTNQFEYAGAQYFFKIPQTFGTIGVGTGTNSGFVYDSAGGQPVSDFPSAFWPRNPSVVTTIINGISSFELRLAANTLPGAGNGLILAQNDPKLIMRMKIRTLNGTQLNPNIGDLFFRDSCSDNPVSLTRTKINVYIGLVNTEITRCANHSTNFNQTTLNLISPDNNSLNNYLSLNFMWHNGFDSKSFRLLISKNVNLTDIIYNDSTLTDTTKFITGFEGDRKYYWNVTGKDSSGNLFRSSVWNFTTKKYLINPPDSSVNNPLVLNFQWNKIITNVLRYKLQIATDSALSSLIFDDSTLTDTSKVVDLVSYSGSYYWRVTARDSLNDIITSNIQTFGTSGQLISPLNNFSTALRFINFSWHTAGNAISHKLQVSTDINFNNIVFNDSSITDTFKTVSSFSPNTSYYWRVMWKNDSIYFTTSETRNFSVSAAQIALNNPPNNAVSVPIPVNFSWFREGQITALIPGDLKYKSSDNIINNGGARSGTFNTYPDFNPNTTYKLEVAADLNFNNIVFMDSTIIDSFKTVSNLSFNTNYYWRVTPKNDSVFFVSSNIRTFRTSALGSAPVITISNFIINGNPSSGIGCGSYLNVVFGDVISFTISASDADGDSVTLSFSQSNICGNIPVFTPPLPLGPVINPVTNLNWTNSCSFLLSGFHFFANDGHGNITQCDLDFDSPVPVELASFVSVIHENNVTLNWTTAAEENNSGFEIERSNVKGQTSDEWSKIGFISGNGTINSPKNYSLTDRNLSSGKYNYRLKQIDNNGNFAYFNLGNEVVVGIPGKFDLSQNYPNPFNPSTKINYELPFDVNVSIKIYDISGKEVSTLLNEVRTAGYYTVNFNASDLASGIYFYTINAKNFIATKKMLLMK